MVRKVKPLLGRVAKSTLVKFYIGAVVSLALFIGLVIKYSDVKHLVTEAANISRGVLSAPSYELSLPPTFSDYFRKPQKLFPGRKVVLKAKQIATVKNFKLTNTTTGKEVIGTNETERVKEEEGEEEGDTDSEDIAQFTIPTNTPPGAYALTYTYQGIPKSLKLSIAAQPAYEPPPAPVANHPAIAYRTKICDNCGWEYVLGGSPNNSNSLYRVGGYYYLRNTLARSSDKGKTWIQENVDDLITNNPGGSYYIGDPKLTFPNDQQFILSSLSSIRGSYLGGNQYLTGGVIYTGTSTGRLNEHAFSVPPSDWFSGSVDFPKTATSQNGKNIFVVGNYVPYVGYVDSAGKNVYYLGEALFASFDYGNTFKTIAPLDLYAVRITGIQIGPDGLPLIAFRSLSQEVNIKVRKVTSLEPYQYQDYAVPGKISYDPPRLSTVDNRSWLDSNQYPQFLLDSQDKSPYKGRLYIVWSEPRQSVSSATFEYPTYGQDYNVFVTYSDDGGRTWSTPTKASDDTNGSDQIFGSPQIDRLGKLHIAFFDHRNYVDKPWFDVYYTVSTDGGNTFSKNIRITNQPFINDQGGRSVGDYFDMVAAYPDKAYIAYPCGPGAANFYSDSGCLAEINVPISLDFDNNNFEDFYDVKAFTDLWKNGITCPANKYCDIDNDGIPLGIGDVSTFGKKMLEKYDLNSDRALDAQDIALLNSVIGTSRPGKILACPEGKNCDIDYNGSINSQDSTLLKKVIDDKKRLGY